MPQLFIFGDSITWGAWDLQGGGWAQRLKTEIDTFQLKEGFDFWCPTYNLGISGDTSAGLSKRIEGEFLARREPKETPIILIAIGINDSLTLAGTDQMEITEFKNSSHPTFKTSNQALRHARTSSNLLDLE